MTSTFRDWYGEQPQKLTGQLNLKATKAKPAQRALSVKEVVSRQLHTNRRTHEQEQSLPDRR